MSRKGKNFKMPGEKLGKKVLGHDLVSDLKKDHNELSGLIGSFTNTLTKSKLRQARKILCQIEDAVQAHFKFENGYLYPRMRRLMFVMLEKLCNEQLAIRGLMEKSQGVLKNKNGLTRNSSAVVSEMALAVSRHLKDCDDVVLLADKFSSEEKDELCQKLNEYRERDKDKR